VICIIKPETQTVYFSFMKFNTKWHLNHPMPKNPTLEQRIAWHTAHIRHCQCRGIPDKLLAEMKRRGIVIPKNKNVNHL
jgi:hypothetical protein